MVYQLRVDCVKYHFEKKGEKLDDHKACARLLSYEEYLASRIPWCMEFAWPGLCSYWVSKKYLIARQKAQDSRNKSRDIAQNRGGARPFGECQQILEDKYGPEKAGKLHTYAAMKVGLKNLDENGNTTTTMNAKAQKHIDNYVSHSGGDPVDWDLDIDPKLLYEATGGIPHGRLAIGDGAIKKSDVLAAKYRRPGGQPTRRQEEHLRKVLEENARLKSTNEFLVRKTVIHDKLIMGLYKELNKEPPTDLMEPGSSGRQNGGCNSPLIPSQEVNDSRDIATASDGGGNLVSDDLSLTRNANNSEDVLIDNVGDHEHRSPTRSRPHHDNECPINKNIIGHADSSNS